MSDSIELSDDQAKYLRGLVAKDVRRLKKNKQNASMALALYARLGGDANALSVDAVMIDPQSCKYPGCTLTRGEHAIKALDPDPPDHRYTQG